MLIQYPPEYFDKVPEKVCTDIISAIKYNTGETDLKHIVQDLKEGNKQLWIHMDEEHDDQYTSCVVTQVTDHPLKRTCEILYLGGKNSLSFIDEIHTIEDWARFNNCDDIQCIGRPGWERVLKRFGYERRYTVAGKQLR